MDELHSILIKHNTKFKKTEDISSHKKNNSPTTSEIPDIFFDDILKKFKMSRVEIQVLMHLYRMVWCRPNIYARYGLTPLLSYAQLSKELELENQELMEIINNLVNYGFIETIRAGQYLVHRYFTHELDLAYGQVYDE